MPNDRVTTADDRDPAPQDPVLANPHSSSSQNGTAWKYLPILPVIV
jgi:hypothetical protein